MPAQDESACKDVCHGCGEEFNKVDLISDGTSGWCCPCWGIDPGYSEE